MYVSSSVHKHPTKNAATFSNDAMICGDLSRVPEKDSKSIRLFLSSTFTDMTVERNALMCDTFPRLQEYFRGIKFDFQVVDLRWGIREEAVHDHQAATLCTNEILTAQNVSRGACFLALLGDKYGSCPLPASIIPEDFSTILRNLKKIGKNPNLLIDWYKLDENVVPPNYILLAIPEKLPHFNDSTPEHIENRLRDRITWVADENRLRTLLQQGATASFEHGEFTAEKKHSFFMAVTEREISAGILNDRHAANRALCFQRTFTNFNPSSKDATFFADVYNQQLDLKSQSFLNELKGKKLKAILPKGNLLEVSLPWEEGGINPLKHESHAAYLDKLKLWVFEAVKNQSEKRIKETEIDWPNFYTVWYQDLIHHAQFCMHKVSQFEGRRKLLVHCQRALERKFPVEDDQLQDFRSASDSNGTFNKPIIIFGQSGFGKTSLMSKVAFMFGSARNENIKCITARRERWLHADRVLKVVRFLGTSPQSCTIRDVLCSTIRQIAAFLDIPSSQVNQGLPASFSGLCDYFQQLLCRFNEFESNDVKILIMFDAIDQLSPEDGAYDMHWLPLKLPPNVYLMVSMLSEDSNSGSCLENLQKLLPDQSSYIQIFHLPMDTAENILGIYCGQANRKLTPKQRNLILAAFKNSAQPLFLKLAFDLAKQLRSFSDISSLTIGKSCKDLINQLFDVLKTRHGTAVVWALQYITASKEGLSDGEMEDLLSLDDHVLQDVYIYHLPPAESSVIRLPPMLWRRIRHELADYLVEKEAGNALVVNWYHRQFWETARLHLANRAAIHQNMAVYFKGDWAGRSKGLTLYKVEKADYPNASRNVPSMPYIFGENVPNLRKLDELPYHSVLSYDMFGSADLLTDFEFLQAKLRFTSLKALLSDFKLYFDTFAAGRQNFADLVFVRMLKEQENAKLELSDDIKQLVGSLADETIEVKIVHDLIVMSADTLKSDWSQLAANILARLNSNWQMHRRIRKLTIDARKWMQQSTLPLLMPRFPCMQTVFRLAIPYLGRFCTEFVRLSQILFEWHSQQAESYGYSDWSNILYVTSSGLLYCREQRWNSPDALLVYDTANNGELIRTIRLHVNIDSCRFIREERLKDSFFALSDKHRKLSIHKRSIAISQDLAFSLRYLLIRTRSTKQSASQDIIMSNETKQQIKLLDKKDTSFIAAPASERFIVAVHESIKFSVFEFGAKDEICYKHTDSLPLTGVSTRIVGIALAPDEKHLVLATRNGLLHIYDLTSQTFLHHFGYSFDDSQIDEQDCAELKLLITTDNRLICRALREDNANNVYVYDLKSGDGITVCQGSRFPVDILNLHKSERWIAGATRENLEDNAKQSMPLYLWSLKSGNVIFRVRGNKGPYSAAEFIGQDEQFLAFSRKYDPGIIVVYLGTPDKPAHTAQQVLKLGGHAKAVCCMLRDPTETMLLTASPDNTIKIWDLATSVILCEIAAKNQHLQKAVDRSKKEDRIKFATPEERADPLRFVTFRGNLDFPLDKKTMGGCHAHAVAISRNARYVATGCMFGRVVFFDLLDASMIVVQAHPVYVKRVHSVEFSPDDSFVATAGSDVKVMFWDYKTGAFLRCFIRAGDSFQAMRLVANGTHLIACHNELHETVATQKVKSRCFVWKINMEDSKNYDDTPTIIQSAGCFLRFACSSNFSHLVTWNGYSVKMFDLSTKTEIFLRQPEVDGVEVSTGEGYYAKTYDVKPQQLAESDIASCNDSEKCLAAEITPDDHYAVIAVFRDLHTVDLSELIEKPKITFKTRISCLTLTRDSQSCLIGRYCSIDLVDLASGSILMSASVHAEFIEAMRFACGDRILATVSQDKCLKIFHFDDGDNKSIKLITSLAFHCPLRVLALPENLECTVWRGVVQIWQKMHILEAIWVELKDNRSVDGVLQSETKF